MEKKKQLDVDIKKVDKARRDELKWTNVDAWFHNYDTLKRIQSDIDEL